MWRRLFLVAASGLALIACSSSTVVHGGGHADGGADGSAPCQHDSDCDDGLSCNGVETCSGGYCAKGTALADGTSCKPPVLDGGTSGGGTDGGSAHICIAGSCALTCTTDAECDDSDFCTGTEICNPTTKTCQTGTPPVCDDNSDCTDNECDPVSGCYYPLLDADGDGHASKTLGACGDDCDDNDKTVYAGAAELCDKKDNNCNGNIDENSPVWYADCDGDGFAPAGAETQTRCDKPTTAPSACSGGAWTDKAPGAGTTDCWDQDPKAHPMTASENNTAWQIGPMAGNAPVSIDFDYNCDGTEEQEYTRGYVSTTATCSHTCAGLACYCSGTSGWSGAPPACGKTGTYSRCSTALFCQRTVTHSMPQPCR